MAAELSRRSRSPPTSSPPTAGSAAGPRRCGPSRSRHWSRPAADYLGTSHRQARVRFEVGALRNGLAELFALPDGYEILLGNGGTTCFWDAASFGLVRGAQPAPLASASSPRSSPRSCRTAPHLGEPVGDRLASPAPTRLAVAEDGIDAYCLTHNETSTGVAMPITRPEGTSADDALVLVDATSAAGGLRVDLARVPTSTTSPPRSASPPTAACGWRRCRRPPSSASSRSRRRAAGARRSSTWPPPSSRAASTRPTTPRRWPRSCSPASRSTGCARTAASSGRRRAATGRPAIVYGWADAHELATPFVADPAQRSHVVATIDFDESVDANVIAKVLRANGILDTESYRKLGRNQLRIALFPAIDPDDVAQLTRSIDHVVTQLSLTECAVDLAPTGGGSDPQVPSHGVDVVATGGWIRLPEGRISPHIRALECGGWAAWTVARRPGQPGAGCRRHRRARAQDDLRRRSRAAWRTRRRLGGGRRPARAAPPRSSSSAAPVGGVVDVAEHVEVGAPQRPGALCTSSPSARAGQHELRADRSVRRPPRRRGRGTPG